MRAPSNPQFASFAAISAIAVACAGTRPTGGTTGSLVSAVPSPASATASANAPSADVKYDVHEWGLIRENQDLTLRFGGVAPPIPDEPLDVDKPVLYFRADAPMVIRKVTVVAPKGKIVETWPLVKGSHDANLVNWSSVSIDPNSACKSSPLPRRVDPPCSWLKSDDLCESSALASVRTVDASCVRVGESTETFLFYRISTNAIRLPLRFSGKQEGEITVTNDGDDAIDGVLLRIDPSFQDTRTITVAPPAPHASIVVPRAPAPTPKDIEAASATVTDPRRDARHPHPVSGDGREKVRATLRELGLESTEADGFMKAWDETIFGAPNQLDAGPGTQTHFLYFLPPTLVERSAQVSFDPPPRTFRRAFVVWVALGP